MRKFILSLVLLLVPTFISAQGLPTKDGTSSNLAKVDSNLNQLTTTGPSVRKTYYITATGLATTAAYNLSIEPSAGTGFKLVNWCVGVSNATAAALVTINVNRRTTASSAGTVATAESTTTPAVSKADPGDANFTGVARVTSTLGTIGALLDGAGFTVGEIAAGTADTGSIAPFCRSYTQEGAKAILVAAGVANGVSITVTAPGAGGLASGSITATIIEE